MAWGEFRKTHLVADVLRKECENRDLGEWEKKLTEIADIGDETEPHVSLSRYPGLTSGVLWLPGEEYDADAAKDYIEKTELAIKVTDEFIEWWFTPE